MDLERARPDKAKRLTSGKGAVECLEQKTIIMKSKNKSMHIHGILLLPFPRAQAAGASNQRYY